MRKESILEVNRKREEEICRAINDKLFEVRLDGSIWRLAIERSNRWNSNKRICKVEPHRVDSITKSGYRLVKVMRNGEQVTAYAHRVVFICLKGDIPYLLTVNHKNGVKSDNRPDNLELATKSEQTRHAIDILHRHRTLNQAGENSVVTTLDNMAVSEIRIRRNKGDKLKKIAKDFNISESSVSAIVLGKRWAK